MSSRGIVCRLCPPPWLGVLIIAALLCAGAASTAGATPAANYYGANIQPIFEKGFVPAGGADGLIADMGADSLQTARMDAIWAWAEPNAPVNGVHAYTWNPANSATSMDHLVGMLASHGVRMLAVLSSPPAWAGGIHLAAAHYGDFVAFAGAFAARYGAGGSFWAANPQLPYLPVVQFEVWTEANSTNFWTGSPNPAEYLKVLKPLYSTVHAADPTGQVLASIGWQSAASYLSQLYSLGVKGSIDAVGFHPYAPDAAAIVGLTQQLRATLVSVGDPNLPIYLTETGQPAAPSGPGADYAYDGPVSDQARAATLTLAGDALARSDCNVQSYDVYALVGSGTNAEPGGEGYMGILNYTTGQPNITGQALINASRAWQANPTSGLVLCNPGATPTPSLLPLGLSLTHTSPTCLSATVTYNGNPLEAADLVMRTADGRVDPAATNAFGQTQMCLQNGPAITTFTAYAELSSPNNPTTPNIAQSTAYTCTVSTTTTPPCTQTNTTTPNANNTPGKGGSRGSSNAVATLKGCHVQLALLHIRGRRTSFHARLTCKVKKQPAARMTLSLRRRGKHTKTKVLTHVNLSAGHWRTITLRLSLRAGDRVSAATPASRSTGLPALHAAVTASRKLLRTASHPSRR